MVLEAVVEVISNTSGHFEWVSIMIIYILPYSGPAKSIWTLDQGFGGQIHGFNGHFSGDGLTDKQGIQDLTLASVYTSNPGHHT